MGVAQDAAATAAQIRMAVAGLSMTIEEIAERSGVDPGTVRDAVRDAVRDGSADGESLARIRAVLEAAGAEFPRGKERGATVYVRTDVRPRPAVRVDVGLRYGSPRIGLCGRWMGRADLTWDGLVLGVAEGAGDFVRLRVATDCGTVGPFYFESPEKATAFLTEALVEQGRNQTPMLPEAVDLVERYLLSRNGCRASVAVAVAPASDGGEASVSVFLKPPADLEEALPADLYPRTSLSLEEAENWLQEAWMALRLRHLPNLLGQFGRSAADESAER